MERMGLAAVSSVVVQKVVIRMERSSPGISVLETRHPGGDLRVGIAWWALSPAWWVVGDGGCQRILPTCDPENQLVKVWGSSCESLGGRTARGSLGDSGACQSNPAATHPLWLFKFMLMKIN